MPDQGGGDLTMKPEGGVTDISLENAKELLAQYGRPTHVRCYQKSGDWETYVDTTWVDGLVHTFSGFSWGYPGRGPHGLAEFFEMIGLDVSVEDLAGWPQEDFEEVVFTIGKDY
jgi:hypothetical protein